MGESRSRDDGADTSACPEFPVPRRKIRRAFLSWLKENRGRLALDIDLGNRTDTVQEFSFAGINPAIGASLTTWEIEVWAINVGANPKRVPGGYVCDLYPADARRVFADRPALWTDHLYEGLLEWVTPASPGRNGWHCTEIRTMRPGRGCCRATIPRKRCGAAA
jgi:hypothetical protein